MSTKLSLFLDHPLLEKIFAPLGWAMVVCLCVVLGGVMGLYILKQSWRVSEGKLPYAWSE